jgi:hypothetical protein
LEVTLSIIHLNNVLQTATEQSIPNYKAKGDKIIRKTKGHSIWNQEIGEASKNSKVAFYKWKQSGTPRDPDNQEHKNMKQSKKLLRQKQRQARARCRDKKYCDIMESSEYNQRLLYKFVNEQRKSKNSETEILIIDGTVITEDNTIIEAWKTHFEGLGTPIDKPHLDQRHNTLINLEYLVIKTLLTDPRNRK